MSHYLNNKVFTDAVIRLQKATRDRNKLLLLQEGIDLSNEQLKKRNTKTNVKIPEDMSKKINQEFKDAQEYITPMLYKLSEGLCQRYNRSDYEDSIEIEDFVHDGILCCLNKIERFDADYINPKTNQPVKAFNYFTTVLLNVLRQGKRNKSKFERLRSDYFEENGHRDLNE